MAIHPNSLANLTNRGRKLGSKNKISVAALTDLQTPEQIAKQWNRLIHTIEHGKDADAHNAIKLIWTYTIDNEEQSNIEEEMFNIKEAQQIILEAVKNGFKDIVTVNNEDQGVQEVQ